MRAHAEPVLLDDLLHDGARLTARAAAAEIERAAGTLQVVDDRLVVSLPQSKRFTLGLPSTAVKAAQRLYACEAEIVGLAKRGKIDAAAVPDRFVLPSGKLAPT